MNFKKVWPSCQVAATQAALKEKKCVVVSVGVCCLFLCVCFTRWSCDRLRRDGGMRDGWRDGLISTYDLSWTYCNISESIIQQLLVLHFFSFTRRLLYQEVWIVCAELRNTWRRLNAFWGKKNNNNFSETCRFSAFCCLAFLFFLPSIDRVARVERCVKRVHPRSNSQVTDQLEALQWLWLLSAEKATDALAKTGLKHILWAQTSANHETCRLH